MLKSKDILGTFCFQGKRCDFWRSILLTRFLICSDQISEKTPIPPPDWEALIEVVAKDMIEERSPARILQVRAKLYDLLTHCIPATTILKVRPPKTCQYRDSS